MIPSKDYSVAIPSYRRASTLAEKTLPMLLNGGVDPGRITVFVCDDERDAYAEKLSRFPVSFADAKPTLRAARNIIARYYPAGHPVVEVDDDLKGLIRRLDDKTVEPVINLHPLFVRAFDEADREGARLWGLYPVKNPYFMKDRITTDLKYIGGGLFGLRFTGKDDPDFVVLDDKEDFERSCRFYLHDGKVVRFGNVSWLTTGYGGAGGMQTYRTDDTISAGAREMVRLFPDLATLNLSKKSGHAEVRLRDGRTGAAESLLNLFR